MRKIICAVLVAVTGLLTVAVTCPPASAQVKYHVAGSVTYQSGTAATLTVTSTTGCETVTHLNLKANANGFERVEAVISKNLCGWPVEAAATCLNSHRSPHDIWGVPVTGVGGESFAPCNNAYKTFSHGGARVEAAGTWYYWTYVFPKP
jgi:hypothetical protein